MTPITTEASVLLTAQLGKLFTSILNERVIKWNRNEDIITDVQFGFQAGRSTTDAIFALHSLITEKLNKNKRLYCCFIDYQKAFDTINREKLWYKLVKSGITGKFLRILKSLYVDVRLSVRSAGEVSKEFTVNTGPLQGKVLSPIL